MRNTTAYRKSLYWRHNDHDGISNHQPHGSLLNRLFRRTSGPVTRKMFPFDHVIGNKRHPRCSLLCRQYIFNDSLIPLFHVLYGTACKFHHDNFLLKMLKRGMYMRLFLCQTYSHHSWYTYYLEKWHMPVYSIVYLSFRTLQIAFFVHNVTHESCREVTILFLVGTKPFPTNQNII